MLPGCCPGEPGSPVELGLGAFTPVEEHRRNETN